MTKDKLLLRLEAIAYELTCLKNEISDDPGDPTRYPDYFSLPVSTLQLKGVRRSRLINAFMDHKCYSVGNLVRVGRATVAKWPGVSGHHISVLQTELKERFDITW